MNLKSICTLLILFCVGAGPALAQPGIAPWWPDQVGIYSDQVCSNDNIDVVAGNVATIYVVLTQKTAGDVTGFECNVVPSNPGGLFLLGSSINFINHINIATPPEFFVGSNTPTPPGAQGELVLVSLDYLVTVPTPIYFRLEPVQSLAPSIPGSMAYQSDISGTIPMEPVSGDIALPVFGFNTGPVWQPTSQITVDPDPDTISPGWTLSGPDGFSYSGSGYEIVSNLVYGNYSLQWAPYPDWASPSPNPVSINLTEFPEVVLGTYLPPTGEILVDADPDQITPSWQLSGPDGYEYFGAGDETVSGLEPGEYSLFWNDFPGWTVPALNPVPQIVESGVTHNIQGNYRALPRILSVLDVPNDQGRQVRLTWERSPHDVPGAPYTITEYGVYRQQPAKSSDKLAGWDFLGTAPARTDAEYQLVVATLCDSTISEGWCPSTFMVSAMTADPSVFFDSLPGTGYSVDNLNPIAPSGFMVAFGADQNVLSWDAPQDTDVDHYLLYRTNGGTPDPSDTPLARVNGTDFQDAGGWGSAYWLVAVDHAGNRSEMTSWSDTDVSGVGGGSLPTQVALHPAAPNPFNPSTSISFDLPRGQHVRLSVYGLNGSRVAELVNEVRGAGVHQVQWKGTDNTGQRVASGAYVYRLETEGFSESKRIMLVK